MTPNNHHTAGYDRIGAEAASWIAQLDSGKFSHADRMALAEWIARSPRHEAEIRMLASLWGDVDMVLDKALDAQPGLSVLSVIRAWILARPLHFSGVATAMSVLVVALTIGFFTWLDEEPRHIRPLVVQVERGQMETITLHDGSVVQLNTNSIAEIEDSSSARLVRLLQGEGFFQVERDPNRPFQVVAGDRIIESVGTKFSVSLINSEINVAVSEGSVKLARAESAGRQRHQSGPVPFDETDLNILRSGYKARVVMNQIQIQPVEDQVLQRETAWIDGVLIFDGQTLEEVINEVSRYTDEQIILSDAELGSLRMGGVFPVGEVDALLDALSASLNVEVVRMRDDLVYLRKSKD